jgi:hypothetical protein
VSTAVVLVVLYAGFYHVPRLFSSVFYQNLISVQIYVALECAFFLTEFVIMFLVQIEIIYDYGREDND